MTDNRIIKAHDFCSDNKKSLTNDSTCGCFNCLKIFNPKKITEWIEDSKGTAVCPYCGVDSIIGESSNYPITKSFLKEMREYWF